MLNKKKELIYKWFKQMSTNVVTLGIQLYNQSCLWCRIPFMSWKQS